MKGNQRKEGCKEISIYSWHPAEIPLQGHSGGGGGSSYCRSGSGGSSGGSSSGGSSSGGTGTATSEVRLLWRVC